MSKDFDWKSLDPNLLDLAAFLYLNGPDNQILAAAGSLAPLYGIPWKSNREEAKRDFFDLFFVPVSGRYLPPYESIHLEKRLWGRSTHQVARLYQTTGFEPFNVRVAPVLNHQCIPDHLGYELLFVNALLKQREQALPEEISAIDSILKTFWEDHIQPWIGLYGEKLEQFASSSLYQFLGCLTQTLVD